MIKAGIIGSTGYAGGELVRILTGHKEAEIKWYGSRSYIDQKYAAVYQNLFQCILCVRNRYVGWGKPVCRKFKWDLEISLCEELWRGDPGI